MSQSFIVSDWRLLALQACWYCTSMQFDPFQGVFRINCVNRIDPVTGWPPSSTGSLWNAPDAIYTNINLTITQMHKYKYTNTQTQKTNTQTNPANWTGSLQLLQLHIVFCNSCVIRWILAQVIEFWFNQLNFWFDDAILAKLQSGCGRLLHLVKKVMVSDWRLRRELMILILAPLHQFTIWK